MGLDSNVLTLVGPSTVAGEISNPWQAGSLCVKPALSPCGPPSMADACLTGLYYGTKHWECHRTVDYGIPGCLLTARTRLRILLHTMAKHLEAATVGDRSG